jgi:hypothetical protein
MLMLFILITVVVSQLHLLRNLTSLYIVAYFGSFALTMVVAAVTLRTFDRGSRYLLKLVAILFLLPCVAIVPGLVGGEPYSASYLGMGLGRLLFTMPIFVVVLLMPRTEANLRALMVTAGVLTVIASLTIPYQFLNGPVSWFAESSERAGLIRFASLFGSITTLGIVCGMGIVVCAYSFRSPTLISAAMLCIAMGAVLSLSKASLVNVATAFIMLPFVRRTTRRDVLVFLLLLFIGLNIVIALFGDELLSFWLSFRFTEVGSSTLMDDVSLSESLVDRLTALPMLAVNFHGPFSLLLGVGPIGGAGTFGYPDAPTVHNGLVELLLVGGVPVLAWYLWLNKRLVSASLAMMRTPGGAKAGRLGLFIFASLFVNSIFSSGMMFNPIGALFFSIALKLVAPGVFPVREQAPAPSDQDERAAGRAAAPGMGGPGRPLGEIA